MKLYINQTRSQTRVEFSSSQNNYFCFSFHKRDKNYFRLVISKPKKPLTGRPTLVLNGFRKSLLNAVQCMTPTYSMQLEASPTAFVVPDSLSKTQIASSINIHSIQDGLSIFKIVQLDQIFPSKFQPRNYFDEGAMDELISSVKQHGVITPMLVRPVGSTQYELVAGERRYKAAKTVGLVEVPVTIREMSDTEVLEYALIENLQRENLNPVEETESVLELLALNLNAERSSVISLLNQMANQKRGLTDNVIRNEDWDAISSVFQSIGKFSPESFRTNRLPLLHLPPEILDAIRVGRIKYTKAKAIARIKDPKVRGQLLDDAIAHSLSLSAIKERISQYQAQQNAPTPSLKRQINQTYAKIKKSKVWDDPNKRQELEALLAQMKVLLSAER